MPCSAAPRAWAAAQISLGLAQARFDRVRVRTFEVDAARLYEALDFEPVEESDTTHCFFLRRMSTVEPVRRPIWVGTNNPDI